MVTSSRKTISDPLGLRLRLVPGQENAVYVHSIDKSSLFARTYLREGMNIAFINDHFCRGLQEAQRLLRSSTNTSLLVLKDAKSHMLASIVKPSPTSKTGLGIRNSKSGKLAVSSVDGLFATTKLEKGMLLLKINNQSCEGMTLSDAVSIIQQSESVVTVLADSNSQVGANGLVVASAVKPTKDTKIGVGFKRQNDANGMFLVSSINPTGPFAKTGLRVGMAVLKINGTELAGMSSRQLLELIAATEGVVAFLARETPSCTFNGDADLDLEAGMMVRGNLDYDT